VRRLSLQLVMMRTSVGKDAKPAAPAASSASGGDRRRLGRLDSWNDERGFGYVRTDESAELLFVHIKSFRTRPRRPLAGDPLTFIEGTGRNGRPAAEDVEIDGLPAPAPGKPSGPRRTPIADVTRVMAALSIFIAVATLSALGRAPIWFGVLYYTMGLASLMLYSADKRYAIAGRSRVRETSMHVVDALFGIGGGLFAQHVFRHKTRKRAFRYITRLIYIVHATLLTALLGGLISFETLIKVAR
jgi:uncharacterized membrane protein YsdA (DUF1294 family)/cold shock CspA family protein